jgi:hypothetical protein
MSPALAHHDLMVRDDRDPHPLLGGHPAVKARQMAYMQDVGNLTDRPYRRLGRRREWTSYGQCHALRTQLSQREVPLRLTDSADVADIETAAPDSGVSVEEIARMAGHAHSRVTETTYRHELRPVTTTGAEVMDAGPEGRTTHTCASG